MLWMISGRLSQRRVLFQKDAESSLHRLIGIIDIEPDHGFIQQFFSLA